VFVPCGLFNRRQLKTKPREIAFGNFPGVKSGGGHLREANGA
jgi:hypothetical protein